MTQKCEITGCDDSVEYYCQACGLGVCEKDQRIHVIEICINIRGKIRLCLHCSGYAQALVDNLRTTFKDWREEMATVSSAVQEKTLIKRALAKLTDEEKAVLSIPLHVLAKE